MKKRSATQAFDQYLDGLCEVLGHADRAAGLTGYCRALMQPLERKSVEPLAAYLDPRHVRARHQALHHFVAKSEWSDTAVLERVRAQVLSRLDVSKAVYWIVDDTGFPKKGRHSVGVTRQYCGQLGKQDNCQVAVSVSLATAEASVPVAWQLYLPQAWADDAARRERAGVPQEMTFATKPEIALRQMQQAAAAGLPVGTVLADAAYGTNTAWRDALVTMELRYAVSVVASVGVWASPQRPVPPAPRSGKGRPAVRHRRDADHQPVSVKALAHTVAARRWRTVKWREGSNATLVSRFAAVRVRAAQGDRLRPEEWLLIEWPRGDAEPLRYWLSNLPANTSLKTLVTTAKARWRIERDYQELKQEFGLDHYEGRGWRGFHHHATLCIAAYGFLVSERLAGRGQKKRYQRPKPAVPENFVPRGTPTRSAPRAKLHHDAPVATGTRHHRAATATGSSSTTVFMTQ